MQNSRFRRISAVLAVAGLVVAFAACSSSGSKSSDKSSASSTIVASGFKFTVSPVAAGKAVTITNNDSVTHTVSADDGKSFDVSIDAGKTATFTAPAAGKYPFHCKIHTTMKATLDVT
jgi:plastocyanin